MMSTKDRQRGKDKADRCQSTTDNSSLKKTHASKSSVRPSSAHNPRKRKKSRSASASPDRGKKRKRHAATVKEERRKKHRKNKKTHRKKEAKKSNEKSKRQPAGDVSNAKDAIVDRPKEVSVGGGVKAQGHVKVDAKPGKGGQCYAVSDNESELNLSKPMRRLMDYIDDKRELCHQTFKTLRGRKLNSMIPEVLRGIPLTELRDLCHSELSGMSTKRVLRILNGDEPEGISSSSSSSSSSASESEPFRTGSSSSSASSSSQSAAARRRTRKEQHSRRGKARKASRRREKEKVSTPEAVVDSTCKIEEPSPEETKLADKDIPSSDQSGANKAESERETLEDQDVLVVSATDLNLDLDHELAHRDPLDEEEREAKAAPPPESAEQTALERERAKKKELEIFELEMRARAIRSMILAQETKHPRLRLKKL